MKFNRTIVCVSGIVLFLCACASAVRAQQLSSLERDRDQQMLRIVIDDVRKHYYDPNYHSVDLNAQLATAKQRMEKSNSNNMALSIIAAALDPLNDSHTFSSRHNTPSNTTMLGAIIWSAIAALSLRCAPKATPKPRD